MENVNEMKFQQVAGWSAILSFFMYSGMLVLSFVEISTHLEAFGDPGSLSLQTLQGKESLVRWCMVLDMIGCYLLIIPLVLFLRTWLRPKNPAMVDLFSLCGLGYCIMGAAGAAVLAAVLPAQIEAFGRVTGMALQAYEIVFRAFMDAVYRGIWGLLDTLIAGVWWVGIGYYLRSERPALGLITVVLGVSYFISGMGRISGLPMLTLVGLLVYFVISPLWALWMGIDLVRTSRPGFQVKAQTRE